MKKQDLMVRSCPEFKKMLNKIKVEKVKRGKSTKMLSDRRLTLAMSRIPNIEDYLVDSDIEDD